MNTINQNITTSIKHLFIIAAMAIAMLAALPMLALNTGQAFAQTPQTGEPVQFGIYMTIPQGQTQGIANLYTVPANKRLIVEFCSAQLAVPAQQRRTFLQLQWGDVFADSILYGPSSRFDIALNNDLPRSGSSADYYTANNMVRFFVNAGQRLRVFVQRRPNDLGYPMNGVTVEVFVSGYLVDVP